MLNKIRGNSFAYAIWLMISCIVHIVLFRAKVDWDEPIWKRILVAVLAVVFVLIVHEFIHYIFMKLFYRGKVKAIFCKDPMGFPTLGVVAEGQAKKWQEVVMRLAPFVLLTVVPDIVFAFSTGIELFFLIVALSNSVGCFYDILDTCIAINRKKNHTGV